MGVTKIVYLINTFSAQCCMFVGKSGNERVKSKLELQELLNRNISLKSLYLKFRGPS